MVRFFNHAVWMHRTAFSDLSYVYTACHFIRGIADIFLSKGLESGENSCTPGHLGNCSECPHKPESAWMYMSQLANKYMKAEYGYTYQQSLYSMKPILKSSEVDDSRPTAIKVLSERPTFISVLSGKSIQYMIWIHIYRDENGNRVKQKNLFHWFYIYTIHKMR